MKFHISYKLQNTGNSNIFPVQYKDAAKVTASSIDIPADSWDEAHRILQNMQKNVSDVCMILYRIAPNFCHLKLHDFCRSQ